MILCALLLQAGGPVMTEADAYALQRYQPPQGAVLEVGGMDFTADGALMLSTRRGQVWRLDDPLAADTKDSRFSLFSEGLWEGLGLRVVDGDTYVLQRGELSRLRDVDGDGRCDAVDTVADSWGVSGHYHEFAFGLPRDAAGNWYISLNVSFGDPEWWHGRSTVPYRGWVMRIKPDGVVEPIASGFRSPCGLYEDTHGRVFVTDNQGDWCASSPIYLLKEGAFYGHPKSLVWTDEYRTNGLSASDEIPPARAYTGRQPAAIWIPYKWSRSTGNLFEITSSDPHGLGQLYPGQYVVAELTNGMLLRAGFEEVQGVLQGWVVPMREDIGSVVRVDEAPDGSIMCGLTNRGWGGKAPADGVARVRWTGRTPLEVHSMHLLDEVDGAGNYGFELTFTRPVAEGWQPAARLVQYDYDYWWEYGSPERHTTELALQTLELSADRKRLVVRTDGLLPAMVARITLDGCVADDGSQLLHSEVAYTVNQLPSGPLTNALVAKIVPPPPSKGAQDEGVLHLSWGDALGQFDAPGWRLVSATLDSDDPTRFRIGAGNGALVNDAGAGGPFTSKGAFGDVHVHLECMLPQGGDSGVYLQGRYEVQLADISARDAKACGGVYPGDGFAGAAPKELAYTGPGEWQKVDVWFTAPRFDSEGRKIANARFERVLLNDTLVQESVELPGPTYGSAFTDEVARGALVVQGTHVPVAIRNVQVKPLDRPADARTWTRLSARDTWDSWESRGDAQWELEGDEIVGRGSLGYLTLPLASGADGLSMRARVKVNDKGAGALVVLARNEDAGVVGVPTRVNATFPDGALTGSLGSGDGAAKVATELASADTWIDLEVDVRRDGDGVLARVLMAGVEVNRWRGPASALDSDTLALRVDHDGTVIRFRDFAVAR
ncbi:MAG: family 16 glycoside hydrolase [Planctomycetota bacterium]